MDQYHLLQEGELAHPILVRSGIRSLRSSFCKYVIPVLLTCTFVTTLALLLVITAEHMRLSKPSPLFYSKFWRFYQKL